MVRIQKVFESNIQVDVVLGSILDLITKTKTYNQYFNYVLLDKEQNTLSVFSENVMFEYYFHDFEKESLKDIDSGYFNVLKGTKRYFLIPANVFYSQREKVPMSILEAPKKETFFLVENNSLDNAKTLWNMSQKLNGPFDYDLVLKVLKKLEQFYISRSGKEITAVGPNWELLCKKLHL